jgi:hypothetical protein
MGDDFEPPDGLEGQIVLILRDFQDSYEQRFLIQELKDGGGKVSYEWDVDEKRWCMVYCSSDDAMNYYTSCQIQAMMDYKALKSKLAGKELGEKVLSGAFEKHHVEFSDFWRRSHKYILVEKEKQVKKRIQKDLAWQKKMAKDAAEEKSETLKKQLTYV